MLKSFGKVFGKNVFQGGPSNESRIAWEVTRADLVKGLEFYNLTAPPFASALHNTLATFRCSYSSSANCRTSHTFARASRDR